MRAQRRLPLRLRLCAAAAVAIFCCGCAATPPPDAAGPRPGEPPYPVLLTENAERRQATLAAWGKLIGEQGVAGAAAPELQPVTTSVRSLPAVNTPSLYLPKVGDDKPQAADLSDEAKDLANDATTESLRRFINSNARLLGAEPQQLSLVLLTDAADGTRTARYEQRPFRYPIANGFGKLEISFTADRRILQIHSTCIPEIEQLQRAGAGTRPRYSSDEVATRMLSRTLTYTDAAGLQQTYTVPAGDSVAVRQLVIYPTYRPGQSDVLEFHLAWEITLKGLPNRAVYLDAVTDEVIAVDPV